MKKPEEYASSIDRSEHNDHFARQDFRYNDVCMIIEKAQKEAWNAALEKAAEEAETDYELGNPYDANSEYPIVDKQSILKLKIE